MRIQMELTERDLRKLVMKEIAERFPDAGIVENDVEIKVKSKRNFKAEWEQAEFCATVNKVV